MNHFFFSKQKCILGSIFLSSVKNQGKGYFRGYLTFSSKRILPFTITVLTCIYRVYVLDSVSHSGRGNGEWFGVGLFQ